MGAGLPTQQVGGCLRVLQGSHKPLGVVRNDLPLEFFEFGRRQCSEVFLYRHHLGGDFSFELGSFVRRHRSEEGSHLLHSCFDRFWCSGTWAVSGVVSFLTALVTRSSYVGSILPLQGVGRSRGVRSTSRRVVSRGASRQRSVEPG